VEIVDFNVSHIAEAEKLAMANYEEERRQVPILPKVERLPNFTHFAENHLGVAAFENSKLVGFLGTWSPRPDAFGTTKVKGTFSPIHAHGAIEVKRGRIYARMYQAAADKWVKEGIRSHALALYTHDKEAIESFFYQGFGLRCIDAIRGMEEIPFSSKLNYEYGEVPKLEWGKLLELHNALITHMGNSPIFMRFPLNNEEESLCRNTEDIRYFAVKDKDRYIAYVKIGNEGENFATVTSGMMNICGAYCLPEYRGTGVYHNLISYLVTALKNEGYIRLGVDCESFNPTARGFWPKYFTEYTYSVVRRIDEKAVDALGTSDYGRDCE